MTRRSFKIATMGAFFVFLIFAILWISRQRPRIMVLHSYSNGYVWTRDINVGLARVLGRESWIEVRYHFMKTKKRSDKDYLRRSGLFARKAIEANRPDVLIAIDDYAQSLAAKYYVDDPKMKIVFAGINGSIAPYGYDKAGNVTGILERKPVEAIKEVITLLNDALSKKKGRANPNPKVLSLADTSHSAERDAKYIQAYDWAPIDFRGTVAVGSFEEWKKTIKGIEGKADFLLVGGYRKLRTGAGSKRFVRSGKVAGWTEANSPVPVIGINVFNTEDGAMLSVGVSPYEQGEVSAGMALDIIKRGKPISKMPIRKPHQYVVSFRRSALKKRNIEVPQIFEAFARATNNYFD